MSLHVTISIVSHGQNQLVNQLVRDIYHHCKSPLTLILTQNVDDSQALDVSCLADSTQIIANKRPKGFGSNHNAAFSRCRTPLFCVMNPDVRLTSDPFPPLAENLADSLAGVVGPLVRHPTGNVEDSARRFPTPALLLRKLLGAQTARDYPTDRGVIEVDWIAGMFMLFRSETYRALGGFDERYFLYYEDVDLCRRIRRAGMRVLYDPRSEAIHDARRASRRDPRLAIHHMASILRFLSRG